MDLNKSLWPVIFTTSLLALPVSITHAASSPWDCHPDPAGHWVCTENKAQQPAGDQTPPAAVEKPYTVYTVPSADEDSTPPASAESKETTQEAEPEQAGGEAVTTTTETETRPEPEQPEKSLEATEPSQSDKTAETPSTLQQDSVMPEAEKTASPEPEVSPARADDSKTEPETQTVEPPPTEPPQTETLQAETPKDTVDTVTQTPVTDAVTEEVSTGQPSATASEKQTLSPVTEEPTPASPYASIEDAEKWELCGTTDTAVKPTAPASTGGQVEINADQVEISKEDVSTFDGNVVVRRDGQTLAADHMTYDKKTEQIDAQSNVRYQKGGLTLEGDSATYSVKDEKGKFDNARFKLAERHARGTAMTIQQDGPIVTQLEKTTYTTCNPGNNDWSLKADKITLDQASGRGVGRNVSMYFKGVPFFYTPYISFPIDDRRKSGFLIPSFGTTSEGGTDLSIPYYWNIAPNQDATLTLRNLSERGAMFRGEFRYLGQHHKGQLDLEHMPDDDVFGQDRTLFAFNHNGAPAPRWNLGVNFRYASDSDYLTDFGDSLGFSSVTHLERTATLSYNSDSWSASGLIQNFQTVDRSIAASSRPYQRLPQLVFNGEWPERAMGLTYGMDAELVQFDRNAGVTGTRLDLRPSISLPIERLGWYATPKLTLQHTRYSLDNQTPGLSDNPDRTLPIFSLDSGVFFERDMTWGSDSYLHTLEPRLFYTYIPHEDQTDIPVFDTGVNTFSFGELFREDRFNGPDRVGDTNQVTLAVTTRLLDNNTGRENLNATIGQVYYFRDRTVTLPGASTQTNNSSDIVAAITAYPTEYWSTGADIQWDTDTERTERGNFYLRYKSDRKHIINLGYRFQDSSLEQTDLSGYWALSPRWNVIGRYLYSMKDEEPLEYLAGLEYQSCCWRTQLVIRTFANEGVDNSDNHTIMLRMELKGLTGFGDEIARVLEEGILGYERDY